MHCYRARQQLEKITLHNDAQRLPIARQNLEIFNETTVIGHGVGNMDNICSACGALMYKAKKTCWKVKSK